MMNKQSINNEHTVQLSPSKPSGGRSVRSHTQPIPFSRAKASGTMFTVTMWSISIPEDSSVREAEQALASLSEGKHFSADTYTYTPYIQTYLNTWE